MYAAPCRCCAHCFRRTFDSDHGFLGQSQHPLFHLSAKSSTPFHQLSVSSPKKEKSHPGNASAGVVIWELHCFFSQELTDICRQSFFAIVSILLFSAVLYMIVTKQSLNMTFQIYFYKGDMYEQPTLSGNSEDLQNLNARLLSIAFSKDEGDWKSIMHTPFYRTVVCSQRRRQFFLESDKSPLCPGDLVISPLTPNIPSVLRKIIRSNTMYLGLTVFLFFRKKTESVLRYSAIFNMIPNVSRTISTDALPRSACTVWISDSCQHLLEILILKIIRSERGFRYPSIPSG